MKTTHFFLLSLLIGSAFVLAGCASTPVVTKQYDVSISSVTGVQVTLEPRVVRNGFNGFQLTVANTGTDDIVVLWEKSTVQYDNKTFHMYVEGQAAETIDIGELPLTVSPTRQISQMIFSVDQLDFSQNTISYDSSDVSLDSTVEDFTSPSFTILPIRSENVVVTLCVKTVAGEQSITAHITPATEAAHDTTVSALESTTADSKKEESTPLATESPAVDETADTTESVQLAE